MIDINEFSKQIGVKTTSIRNSLILYGDYGGILPYKTMTNRIRFPDTPNKWNRYLKDGCKVGASFAYDGDNEYEVVYLVKDGSVVDVLQVKGAPSGTINLFVDPVIDGIKPNTITFNGG